MLELQIKAQRGNFQLDIACTLTLTAPWTVLFGPSGSGKTTLLRMIAGLETGLAPRNRPDQSRIVIHGEPVTDTQTRLNRPPGTSPNRRSTGMVTQQPALFPHLSVNQNIAYGLRNLTQQDHNQRIQEMLDLTQSKHLANRAIGSLSGGEAQRISLARTLAPMPRLLLLDEPMSALDAPARDQILISLEPWLTEHKIQTILVTHDAADALATNAEVLQMQEGKKINQGPAAQVLAKERQRVLSRLT